MNLGKTLYVTNRDDWRAWLSRNHQKEREIWLVYYKKSSGKPRIHYNDAVEEAICYGWIDSTVKKVDDESFAQRFTPRRHGSKISEMNKERVRILIAGNKMTKKGLDAISAVFNPEKDKVTKWRIAQDIIKAVRADRQAWANFRKFPESYRRVRIGYIESQRSHSNEMFNKSLQNFIKKTAKNKKFGMIK
ncbi:MAG: YdeI/OmpD-associated family protein [archaeon]